MGSCEVMCGHVRSCWVILGHVGSFGVILGHVGLCEAMWQMKVILVATDIHNSIRQSSHLHT